MNQVKLSKTRVPFEGPEEGYDMLLVGESPGKNEASQGRPFVGKSGQFLERYLGRARVVRSQVRLANLCKYRPPGDKFRALLGTPQLEEGLAELKEEILHVRPNVVVALGGWPMYYLTGYCGKKQNKPIPGSGIALYRGSRLPALEDFGGEDQKVFCTYHPSYVVNRDWEKNPIFFLDIKHAVEDSTFPDLRYTPYDEFIDPPADVLSSLTDEAISSDWISTDIETFLGGVFSCVGWAFRSKKENGHFKAVCVTYKRQDLWKYAKEIWESTTPKILQFGTYDDTFMRRFWNWRLGGFHGGVGWDTYVAAANLHPNFPRGLDFQCSIHTRFPYYKTDRKEWKEKGDLSILWKYNCKDTVATHVVAEDQMRMMPKHFRRVA